MRETTDGETTYLAKEMATKNEATQVVFGPQYIYSQYP
jgi:hypothetical protein